ncbi:hypothetical protein CAP35_00245 [Chitinophagaceae bacterium IBVUCB1]|nr:hypothetical protein CAP35_00245 [Chitinophagaceae bacterium IBVUCB1]
MLLLVTSLQSMATDHTTRLTDAINNKAGTNAVVSKFRYKAWISNDAACVIRIAEMIDVWGVQDSNPAIYDIDLSRAVFGQNVEILSAGKRGQFLIRFGKDICRKNNRKNAKLEVIFLDAKKSEEAAYKELAAMLEEAIKASVSACKAS